jgi:hypothetical protein
MPQFKKTVWKQKVVSLQSTRSDVERELGKPSSGHDYLVTYKLNDVSLDVEYYPFDHCAPSDGRTAYLNVPEWTVTEMEFHPESQPKVASLHLNLKPLRQAHTNPDLPDFVSYLDDQEGIEYTIDEHTHRLNSVRYFPGSRYDGIRCQKD